MSRLLFSFFCMIFFVTGKGQRNYAEAMAQGDNAFNKQQYKIAINKYFAAEAFDPAKKDSVKAKVNMAFDAIEALRVAAEKAKRDAIKAEAKAKTALAKAEKFIEAFYFYDDKYALILKRNPKQDEKFSFINKEGNAVFQNRYEKAEQFDKLGFAKVQIWEGHYGEVGNALFDYLMDTTGKKYGVAYSVDSITWYVNTLDLRNKKLDSFPAAKTTALSQVKLLLLGDTVRQIPTGIGILTGLESLYLNHTFLEELPSEIGQLTTLQKFNLFGNRLKILPPEIGQLKNLQTLDLGGNLLNNLPEEIGELKKLTTLILTGNPMSKTEIEKIRKRLPNCKIYF